MKTSIKDKLELTTPLLLLFIHGMLYNKIGEIAALRNLNFGPLIETPLDAHVPFVPLFVLPYIFVWFYPILLMGFLAVKTNWDPVPFRQIVVSLSVLLIGCYTFWILFPVYVTLRLEDEVLAQYGWLGELVLFNYNNASQWNACPSFHVAGPWFFYRAVSLFVPRMPKIFLFIVIAIACSTVLIRIHYLADIVFGYMAAELVYSLVLKRFVKNNYTFAHQGAAPLELNKASSRSGSGRIIKSRDRGIEY